MKTLYTISLNGKLYLTTRTDKAWDFCLRFGAEIEHKEQTTRTIDGIEFQERSIDEILTNLKHLIFSNKISEKQRNTNRK